MAPKTINIAIMFADIAGSTKLYDTLGDQAARAKVAATLETMSEITRANKGTVIKTIGDEVMCTFPTAENAGTAAWEMQETFEEEAESNTDGSPVAVRIGMHFGPAILEGGDVFGDAVNIAARMAAQAKAKQIITTQDTLDKLPPAMRASTRFVDHAPIKGKKEEIDIFEVIWQEEDVTRMATGMIIDKPTPEAKLNITYNGQTIELSKARPGLVMGRSQNCDLTINEKLASRQHVRIELRRDKFFIVDQSTNGTHVLIEGAAEEFLRREEIPLNGNGQISLGKGFSEGPDEVVEFKLTTGM
jgi:class 3 adenylate cyclase